MEEKKNKKPIIIGIAVTLLVTLTLLGVTYAYYRTRIIGNQNNTSISVTSKKLEIKYSDNNAVLTATGISPGYETSKEFTVENTGDEEITYAVKLDNVINTFKRQTDWYYELYFNNTGDNTDTIPNGTKHIGADYTIAPGETHEFRLEIYYIDSEEDQSVDMGATLSFRINISENTQKWSNAQEGTLLYAIKNDNTVTSPITTPGRQLSTESEAVLASATDIYGTSYYFRGNVKNNYVNFSGMCWRILRVQGDGTIKIVLADRNNECDSSNYSLDNDDGGFITDSYEKDTGKIFKYKYDGTTSANNIEQSYLFINSDAKLVLDAWLNGGNYTYYKYNSGSTTPYTDIFTKQLNTDKLVTTDWCQDTSISSIDSNNDIYYGAYSRLGNTSTAVPSLECGFTGINNTASTTYNGMISLLTADELAFAGISIDYACEEDGCSIDNNIYIDDNAEADCYVTLTPGRSWYNNSFNEYSPSLWSIYSGFSEFGSITDDSLALRPVVVLSSNVLATGEGTQTDPYVIS